MPGMGCKPDPSNPWSIVQLIHIMSRAILIPAAPARRESPPRLTCEVKDMIAINLTDIKISLYAQI
jgi:cell division protein FtsN